MGEWRYASYKLKGLSHSKDGTQCQDNTCVIDTEDYLVAALADGLGSLKYSEIASDIATKSVCKAFENLNCSIKELPSYLLQYIVSNIQTEADSRGLQLKEMDCTLVFVCIYKKEPKVIVGRLGDSAVCIFGEKRAIALNDGNKSANGTSAVLDRDAIDNFTINAYDYKKEKIIGFILSSDGLENILYMKGSTNVNKAAEEYFNTLVTSDSPELEIRKKIRKMVSAPDSPFDDDISIIVIGCNDEPISLPEDATWLCKCGCRNPLYTTYCIKCNSDFTVLYDNVKFKEHGGKAAFFKKINQNPEEEKRILGIKTESGLKNRRYSEKPNQSREIDVDTKNTRHRQIGQASIDEQNQMPEQRGMAVKIGLSSSHELKQSSTKNIEDTNGYKTEFEKKTQHLMSESENDQNETTRQIEDDVKPLHEKSVNNEEAGSPACDESSDIDHWKKSARKKKNKNGYLVLLGVSVSFSLFLGIVLTSIFLSSFIRKKSKEIDKLNSKIVLLEEEKKRLEDNLENSAPILEENPCIVLDSGEYYWGDLDNNNKPNGIGILQEDNTYYIGQFIHGKKNGEFTVVDSNGHKNVTFDNDEVVKNVDIERAPTTSINRFK